MKITTYFLAALLAISIQANLITKKLHYIVEMKTTNQTQIDQIARHIHIDHISEGKVYSVVNEDDFKVLEKRFSKLIVSAKPTERFSDFGPRTDEYEYPRGDEKFHTYTEISSVINQAARDYPDIAQKFSIGTTVDGRPIDGIKISGSKKSSMVTPAIFMVGSHHAREHLSSEVPVLLINYILSNYSKSSEIKKLVDSREIYIVPMLNSDGAMYDIVGKKYKMWRKNRIDNGDGSHGVDLNRNYSFGWGTGGSSTRTRSDVYMGPKPFSEPETISIKEFVETHPNIRVLLSFHTFSELILYPWGGKKDDVGGKDQLVYEKMATTMAKWNGYKPMQASDLYVASGDTCDWAYGEHQIFCFTFELSPKSRWSGGFYPGAKVIDKVFKSNIKPALYLIEKAADPYSVLKTK